MNDTYFLINPELLIVLYGPVDFNSDYVKKLMNTGNPDPADAYKFNLVPLLYTDINTVTQRYTGNRLVFIDRVELEIENIPVVELQNSFKQIVINKVQELLDTTAQSRGYDSMLSLCSYANSTNLRFKTEAEFGVAFRDGCWDKCLEIFDTVSHGTRSMPTLEEIMSELPSIGW